MLVFLLLIIVAILLFGSSAVIGVAGWVLGFIIAAIALIWLAITLDLDPMVILMGVLGIIAISAFAFRIFAPEVWAQAEEDRKNREREKRDAKKR